MSNVNFTYIPEVMNETTIIRFFAPYSFHIVPFENIGIYGGVNLNATLTPYSNDQTTTVGDVELNMTSSLSGGSLLVIMRE